MAQYAQQRERRGSTVHPNKCSNSQRLTANRSGSDLTPAETGWAHYTNHQTPTLRRRRTRDTPRSPDSPGRFTIADGGGGTSHPNSLGSLQDAGWVSVLLSWRSSQPCRSCCRWCPSPAPSRAFSWGLPDTGAPGERRQRTGECLPGHRLELPRRSVEGACHRVLHHPHATCSDDGSTPYALVACWWRLHGARSTDLSEYDYWLELVKKYQPWPSVDGLHRRVGRPV